MIFIDKTPNADTRSAIQPLDRETLLLNSTKHIFDVQSGMEFFRERILTAATFHDWTKIAYIDEFTEDAKTGKFGKDFKALPWYKKHISMERHHILDDCPEDVNLIDLLERVCDIVMAGMARTGEIYNEEIPNEILQKAYKNTIELLKAEVRVREEKK